MEQAVDMALISGVPELKIMEVKRKEITESIRESIVRRGNRPGLFSRVVIVAVKALEFLITNVLFKKSREVLEQTKTAHARRTETEHPKRVAENIMIAVKVTKEEKVESEQPQMTRLASKHPQFFKVNKELGEQNGVIQEKKTAFCKEERIIRSQGMI